MLNTKKEKKKTTAKDIFVLGCVTPVACVILCVVIAGLLAAFNPKSETSPDPTPAPELSDWRKYMWGADKCVIGWSFSPSPVPCYKATGSIEMQLKDPDSYKFLDLRCNFTRDSTAAAFRDTVDCFIEFTATNSFGGRVRNTADVKMLVPAWTPAEDGLCTILDSRILQ